MRRNYPDISCVRCGVTVTEVNSSHAKYCDNCRSIARKEKHRPQQSAWLRAYRKANPEKAREYDKITHQKWGDKEKARRKLHWQVEKGNIVRPDYCSACLNECKPDGHHEDYDKPLDVIWLCKPCHKQRHIDQMKASIDELFNVKREK